MNMHHHCFLLHLLQYVILILVLLLLSASAYDRPGEFTFNGFTGGNDLTMDGGASVTNASILRLTDYGSGHAFYPYPLNFTSEVVPTNGSSVPSFSTTFVFAIIGHNHNLESSSDGLAFVLSSTKDLHGSYHYSEDLGLPADWNSGSPSTWQLNDLHLLAVELDTIQNLQFQDIDSNHIGIDTSSQVSIASTPAGYYDSNDGRFRNLSLVSRKPMQVWVDYDSKQTILNVTLAPYFSSTTKPRRPLLSVTYDLSSVLPTNAVYAGFSSATDIMLPSKYYILGWSFKLNGEAAALNYSALSPKTIQELAQQVPTSDYPRSYKALICKVVLPIVAIVILASIALVNVYMNKRLQARRTELEWHREYGRPPFAYKDLLAATNGFKDNMLLGRGGFGSVYRGVLPVSKQMAAIKRLSPESRQGMKEFMAEIVILGHLRHRNLVQLLGYCLHKQQLILVYDYMPNGSLDYYLHSQHHKKTDLCWAQIFHIIKGVASGLFYLHEDWEKVVIHRDIKTSNVLLDSEMNARLGDFGLARSHDHGADAQTTRMAGTYGYIAPELARLGKATKSTDVFAFGVLMMEVACGRRPIWVNTINGEPLTLADWVLAAWQGGSIIDAIDPMLDDFVEEEIEMILKLGLLCSHPSPNVRPCMRLVMMYLQRDAPLPSNFESNSFLSIGVGQDELHDPCVMSCPAISITNVFEGR